MIPKNLKVGDKFTDGNATFEVLEIVPLGYNSRRISINFEDAPVTAQKAVEQPKEEAQLDSFNKYTKTEIKRLSTDELTKLSKELGLEVGSGVEMKQRIIDHLGL